MANKFGAGSQKDYDNFMVFRRQDNPTVTGGKKWMWFNPNPKDPDTWDSAEVVTETAQEYILQTEKGEVRVKRNLAHERNPIRFDGVEDMSQLSYLSEPAVLYNLKLRYMTDVIHTYSGLFCVVINPYKFFPIYTPFLVMKYQGRRREELAPHVYAVADGAYRAMLDTGAKIRNQSILITGESGAGKTENTKRVIQYLAMTAGQSHATDTMEMGHLERQLIEINPMLEAFGNAATTKNYNSSRFGKFIEIHFNGAGRITGASMQSYLLEKSRVVYQAENERNYHIFYQIIAGSDSAKKQERGLTTAMDYKLINQGGKPTIPTMDDKEEFEATVKAMETLNTTPEEMDSIFNIVAGLLHLGNVKYKQDKQGAEIENIEDFAKAAALFQVPAEQLRSAIIQPKIKAGTEMIQKHLNKEEAESSTKATIKAIYHRLFLHIVNKVNEELGKDTYAYFIGVLDIAGFEIFKHNSFEQLCINLTNEKLQQFFNNHMFNLEQEEYMREKIPWQMENFGEDLQPVINLIEQKSPAGILASLDEQSFLASGKDEQFHAAICRTFGRGHPKFRSPQMGGTLNFDIIHYAGTVTYDGTEWVTKNRDPLARDIQECFRGGKETNTLISKLFKIVEGIAGTTGDEGVTPSASKKGANFLTVGNNHKEQLGQLMTKLRMTNPHFIRCILPNYEKKTRHIVDSVVLDQLRCNGVLEGIRITRKGYPNRQIYSEFLKRYYFLGKNIPRVTSQEKQMVENLLQQIGQYKDRDDKPIVAPGLYQFGTTKVFFKCGVLANIEEVREMKISEMLGGIQAAARAFAARKGFSILREQNDAVVIIQRTLKSWVQFRNWAWWKLYIKARPMIKRTNLEDEIAKRDKIIAELKAQLAEEIKKREEIEKLLADAQTKIGNLTANLENEKNAFEEETKRRQRLEEDKIENENQINDLLDEIDDYKKKINDMKKNLSDEDLKYKDLEAELDSQVKAVNALKVIKTKYETMLEESQQRQSETDLKVTELNGKITELDKTIEELELDLDDRDAKINLLEKAKSKLESELKTYKDDLDAADEEIDQLKSKNKELENNLNLVQTTLQSEKTSHENQKLLTTKMQGERDEFIEKYENEKQQRQNVEKQKKDIDQKHMILKEDFEAMREERNELENKTKSQARTIQEQSQVIDNTTDSQAYWRVQKEKLDQEISNLKQQNDILNSDLKNTQKSKKNIEIDNETLKKELDEAKEEIEELDHKKKNIENDLKNLHDDFDRLTNQKIELERIKKKLENSTIDNEKEIEELKRKSEEFDKKFKDSSETIEQYKEQIETQTSTIESLNKKKGQSDKEIQLMKDQILELQKQLNESNKRRKQAEDESKVKDGEHEVLEENLRKIQSDLRSKEADILGINEKFDSIQQEKDKLNEQVKLMNKQIEELKSSNEELSDTVESLTKQNKKLLNEFEELEEQYDIEKKSSTNKDKNYKKLDTEFKLNKSKLDELTQQNANLKGDLAQAKEENEQLNQDLSKIDDEIANLKNTKTRIEREKQQIEEELQMTKDKSLRDKKKLAEIEEEIELLKSQPTGGADPVLLQQKQVIIDDLTKTVTLKDQQLQTNNEQLKQIKLELNELKSKYESKETELTVLERSKKTVDDELKETNKNLEEQKNKIKGLQKEIDSKNKEIVGLKQANIVSPTKFFEEEVKRLGEEIENLKLDLEDEQNKRTDAELKKKDVESKYDDIDMKLRETEMQREKLSKLKADLEVEVETYKSRFDEEKKRADETDDELKKEIQANDELEKQIDLVNNQLNASEELKKKYEEEMNKFKDLFESEMKNRKELDKTKKLLEADLAEATVKLEGEQKKSNLFETQKKKAEKDLKIVTAQLQGEKSKAEDAENKLFDIEGEYDTIKAELETERSQRIILQKKVQGFDSKFNDMQDQVNMAEEKNKKLVKDKKLLMQKIEDLRTVEEEMEDMKQAFEKRVQKLQGDREQLKRELEKEKTTAQDLEKENAKNKTRVKELEERVIDIDKTSASTAKLKQKFQQEIDDLTAQNEDLMKEKMKIEKKMKLALKEREKMQQQVTEHEQNEGKFTTKLGKIDAEMKALKIKLEDSERIARDIQDEKKDLEKQIANLKVDIQTRDTNITKLKKQINILKRAAAADDDDDM